MPYGNLVDFVWCTVPILQRWIALPGEPPIDDTEVDDWVQRFVVLQGSCIFFYLRSTGYKHNIQSLLLYTLHPLFIVYF